MKKEKAKAQKEKANMLLSIRGKYLLPSLRSCWNKFKDGCNNLEIKSKDIASYTLSKEANTLTGKLSQDKKRESFFKKSLFTLKKNSNICSEPTKRTPKGGSHRKWKKVAVGNINGLPKKSKKNPSKKNPGPIVRPKKLSSSKKLKKQTTDSDYIFSMSDRYLVSNNRWKERKKEDK